jgi:hypothetical protein
MGGRNIATAIAVEQIDFKPPASLIPFFTSEKFIALVLGPVGSTKTSAGIMKIAYHASLMHPCRDGVRRSRAVWVRNTREMLWDTSIPDFLKWFPDGVAGTMMKTDRKFLLKFGDVECEVLFRGLDDANDVRRLLSLQASFAIFDEFREINPDVFSTMQGRLGRYPDKMMLPPEPGKHSGGCIKEDGSSNAHVWGMSNPPDADSFWEQYYNDPPGNADVFTQPGGTDPLADWLQYLPDGYYQNLMTSNDQDWVDVYVHAKFGKSLAGKPVFRSFDSRYHVSDTPIQPLTGTIAEQRMSLSDQEYPLIIGMDFGLTPACTINQQDARGRFLTLDELVSEGMGILRFCREMLRPLLTNRFPGMPVIIIGDPAGTQRAQTDERSVFDVLKAEGFTVIPAKTNSIQARLAAVEALLSGQVDTGARHLIDPRCKKLITALRSGYRYKVKKTGDIEDKPDKNFYSHIADAHQYACLHVDQTFGGAQQRQGRREVKVASMQAWT